MRLWVDTQQVGSNAVSTTQNYTGAWRSGGDRVWSGASSNYLNATFDEFAVYPSVLSEAAVRDHFTAGGRTATNRPPVAAFDGHRRQAQGRRGRLRVERPRRPDRHVRLGVR